MKPLKLIVILCAVTIAFSTCNTKPRYVDVSGRVLDIETGAPISGIDVEAASFGPSEEKTENVQSTTTDGNGNFSIPHFKMIYTSKLFKNQKSSTINIGISSNDYMQYNNVGIDLGKHATAYKADIYVNCMATGTFSISVNGSYTWDYGLVTASACPSDQSKCFIFAGSQGEGIYGFYPSNPGSFHLQIMAGNIYKNFVKTRLYNNNVLIKTQIDTITGLGCMLPFNYTITIN